MSQSDIIPREKVTKFSLDMSNTRDPKSVTATIDLKELYDKQKYRPSSAMSENKKEGFHEKIDNNFRNISTISTSRKFSNFDTPSALIQSQFGIQSRNAIQGKRHLYSSQVSSGSLK